MHTIQCRHVITLEEIGSTDVGCQHAFFNQHVGRVTFGRHNFLNFTLSIEHYTGFDRIEIHRTTLFTFGAQGFIQGVEIFQMRHNVFVMFTPGIAVVTTFRLQHFPDLVIGQARMGVDNTFHKLITGNIPGFGDGHFTYHHQTIHFRVQRA